MEVLRSEAVSIIVVGTYTFIVPIIELSTILYCEVIYYLTDPLI